MHTHTQSILKMSTHMQLGGVVFLMLLAAVSNGGRIYNTDVGLILSRELSPATLFVTIACWMIVLAFTGTIEVFLCVARVYIIKRAKCILVWVSCSYVSIELHYPEPRKLQKTGRGLCACAVTRVTFTLQSKYTSHILLIYQG